MRAWLLVALCAGCLFPDLGPLRDTKSDAAPDAAGSCSDPTVVVGVSATNGETDTIPASSVDSYVSAASSNARVACAWVYLATTPAAPVEIGVYSNGAANPNQLIAHATINVAVAGWNSAPLDVPLDITSGEQVWLGMTTVSGSIEIALQKTGCVAPGRRTASLSQAGALPATFVVTGSDDTVCKAAAYLGN